MSTTINTTPLTAAQKRNLARSKTRRAKTINVTCADGHSVTRIQKGKALDKFPKGEFSADSSEFVIPSEDCKQCVETEKRNADYEALETEHRAKQNAIMISKLQHMLRPHLVDSEDGLIKNLENGTVVTVMRVTTPAGVKNLRARVWQMGVSDGSDGSDSEIWLCFRIFPKDQDWTDEQLEDTDLYAVPIKIKGTHHTVYQLEMSVEPCEWRKGKVHTGGAKKHPNIEVFTGDE